MFGGTWTDFPVIAHHGTVSVDHIIVPRKFATTAVRDDRTNALRRLLDEDIKAYVENLPGARYRHRARASTPAPSGHLRQIDRLVGPLHSSPQSKISDYPAISQGKRIS
jgi:hypothetical protein